MRRAPFRKPWSAGAAVALAMVATRPSWAAPPPPKSGTPKDNIGLVFEAPEGCPRAESFAKEVRERAAPIDARLGPPGPGQPYLVRATISGKDGTFVAQLTLLTASGHTDRELSGATCEELVVALALSTALLFDPAELAASAEPPPSRESKPSPKPTAPEPADVAPPKRSPPVEPAALAPAPPVTSVWASGGAMVLGSLTPVSGAIAVDRAFGGAYPASVRAGIAVSYAEVTVPYGETLGRADLMWWRARASGSPFRLRTGIVDLIPSAVFELGALVGRGSVDPALARSDTDTSSWVAVGLNGRVETRLSSRLLLEFEGGILAPILRRDFRFASPETRIFDVPRVGATLEAGAGFTFP